MAVVKEWQCMAHGYFDGTEPICPHGCESDSMVRRVFLTAPTIQSQGYRNMNATFEHLARENGVSDLRQRGGDGMRRADYWTEKRRADEAGALGWGHKSGQALDGVFKPANSITLSGNNSAMRRTEEGKNVVPMGNAQIPMTPPKPVHSGGVPYDGTHLGAPKGD
jgi:hypothetical protein